MKQHTTIVEFNFFLFGPDRLLFLFFSISDLLLSIDWFSSFVFSFFSVSGGGGVVGVAARERDNGGSGGRVVCLLRGRVKKLGGGGLLLWSPSLLRR